MRKLIWKIALMADGIAAFVFVSMFDVDAGLIPYAGALMCIASLLLLMAGGWNWLMEAIEDKDDYIDDPWETAEIHEYKKK